VPTRQAKESRFYDPGDWSIITHNNPYKPILLA
jgi:hypothetical protein